MEIKRTQEEIEAVRSAAMENLGEDHFEGAEYEMGVINAIDWIIGKDDEKPFPRF